MIMKILSIQKICLLLTLSIHNRISSTGNSVSDDIFRRIAYIGLATMPFNAFAFCSLRPLFKINNLTYSATIMFDLIAMSYLGFKFYKSGDTGVRYDLASIIVPNLIWLCCLVCGAYFNCFNFAITILTILSVIMLAVGAIFILFYRPEVSLLHSLLMIAVWVFSILLLYMSSSYSTLLLIIFAAIRICRPDLSDWLPSGEYNPKSSKPNEPIWHNPTLPMVDLAILAGVLIVIVCRIIALIGFTMYFTVIALLYLALHLITEFS